MLTIVTLLQRARTLSGALPVHVTVDTLATESYVPMLTSAVEPIAVMPMLPAVTPSEVTSVPVMRVGLEMV
jgi:hypothetical protein